MKKFKKFLIPIGIIVAIVLIVTISGMVQANNAVNAQFDAQPITAQVTESDIGVYVSASGMLETGSTEAIHANTQGTVSEVIASAGDFVEAGELLAVVNTSDLDDLIKETEESIVAKQADIDNYSTIYDSYTIKSPVEGRIKGINVQYIDPEEEYNNNDDIETNDIVYEKCEDIEKKYGYLVEIANGDSMYVVTSENVDQYKVGEAVEVNIHDYKDFYYKTNVYVDKIEDGKVYISVPTNYLNDEKEVTIYSSGDKVELGTGITEYLGMTYVSGYRGFITTTNTYYNEKLSVGEVLYYAYTTESQELLDLYRDLEELKIDLEDYEQQLENTQMKAESSGFINSISLVQGEKISDDTIAYKISDTSTWKATVDVDELDINTLREGMTAIVTVDAIPDTEFVGTVKNISSVGENSGGITTYDVAVELNADDSFRVNMNVSSEILVEESVGAVSVPIQAVRTFGDKEYVVVYAERTDAELKAIEDEIKAESQAPSKSMSMSQEEREQMKADMESQGTAKEDMILAELSVTDRLYGEVRFVETGIQDETNIEIVNGLQAGEKVVLPSDQLSEDAEVATVEFGPARNKGF